MKVILITFFLISLASLGHASGNPLDNPGFQETMTTGPSDLLERRGKFVYPDEVIDPRILNRILFSEMQEQNVDLKKVKFFLLNGETRMARVHLNKLAYTQTKLKPVIFRYLGMLSFIEGKFEKSLEYLSLPELQDISHYSKICSLKVLNQVVLNKVYQMENEWEKCRLETSTHIQSGNFVWLETLVRLKVKPYRGLTRAPFKGLNLASLDNEQLKIFLKLALYLNQEKLIEPQLNNLDPIQLQDTEIRELVGHTFFRLGALAKSYRFIEDLNTPNAENIKGNLYVLRNKYELAYAQFKLALEKKQNSQNAMERILPLAWLLGDWEEGAKISERVLASPNTQINKMTLVAAFYTQKGDFEKSAEVLEMITQRSRRGTEVDVTQLHSFVGLMTNKTQVIKKQAALSCDQYDMVNCWLGLQMEQWDTFPLTVRRNEKLPMKKEWEKLSQAEINEPLQETVYVNQLDVEELDDKLVELVPNAR